MVNGIAHAFIFLVGGAHSLYVIATISMVAALVPDEDSRFWY